MHIFPFVVVVYILAVGLYGIVTSRHPGAPDHLPDRRPSPRRTSCCWASGTRRERSRPTSTTSRCTPPPSIPWSRALALTDLVVEAAVTALLLAIAIQAHKTVRHPRSARTRPAQGLRDAPRWTSCCPLARPSCHCSWAAAISALTPLLRPSAPQSWTRSRIRDQRPWVAGMLLVIMIRVAHRDQGVLVRRIPAPSTGSPSASTSRVGPLSAGPGLPGRDPGHRGG